MAAGAATFFRPPMAHSNSSRPTTRLAENAATMTSGRVVRSIVKFPCDYGSEAGGDAGGDGLEEHRRAVMEPQRQRAEQQRRAEARTGYRQRRPGRGGAGCGGHILLGGNGLGHRRPSDDLAGVRPALPPVAALSLIHI